MQRLCFLSRLSVAVAVCLSGIAQASAQTASPKLLTAPFSAEAAKEAQEALSSSLGNAIQEKNSLGMAMVLIPPGEFMMGSPEDEISFWDEHQPDELLHRVRVSKPFRIGAHEIRVRDFRAFVDDTKYQTQAEMRGTEAIGFTDGQFVKSRDFNWRNPGFDQTDDDPVVDDTWNDAVAFCEWLSKREGKHYRLPTEAEWEYACRAGTTTAFHFGRSCNGTQANCNGERPYGTEKKGPYLKRIAKVGSYAPNAFGLYDMSGNVMEWCSDWYQPKYFTESPIDDPSGPKDGKGRTIRGGGWLIWPENSRSANRGGADPNEENLDVGFRVVCDP
jgi:formylglycine-generating enzyme required for sulfatase activity